MCFTTSKATISNTIIYAAETEVNGGLVHVLGYQNEAINQAISKSGERVPNAMILPFPNAVPMGPDNIIDTKSFGDFLNQYRTQTSNIRLARSFSKSMAIMDSLCSIQVFDSGSYTVILAHNATRAKIEEAIQTLPENKQPKFSRATLTAYCSLYRNHTIAICCFDKDVKDEPLLWWYQPKDSTKLFIPALDGHDGGAPNLTSNVHVDHYLVVGSSKSPKGNNITFNQVIPEHASPYLVKRAYGKTFLGQYPNGDFTMSVDDLRAGRTNFQRIAPKPKGFLRALVGL